MKKYAAGFGILSLIAALLIMAFLALQAYGPRADQASSADAGPGQQGAPPPDYKSNAKSTKEYVNDTFCRSNCESTARNCRATADGTEGTAACDTKLQECAAGCK